MISSEVNGMKQILEKFEKNIEGETAEENLR
jgi:hypothetical protein